MKLFLLFLILSPLAFAQDTYPVLKVYKQEKFVFKKNSEAQKGKKVYLYSGSKLMGIGVVQLCKTKACLGKVAKKRKGYKVKIGDQFSFKKLSKKVAKKKASMSSKKGKKKQKEKSSKYKEQSFIMAGYGGPFTNALIFNYAKTFREKFSYFGGVGTVILPIANINMSATYINFGGRWQFGGGTGKASYHLLYAYGITSGTIDFKQVDAAGPEEDVTLVSNIFGIDIDYKVSKKLRANLGVGYATNSLESVYKNAAGEEYAVSFAGGLPYFNFMLQYVF